MRGLKVTSELANLNPIFRNDAAPSKGAAISLRERQLENNAQFGTGNLISDDTITGMGEQTEFQDDKTDWWNSFSNAIDEIDKSNYSGKRKPFELKIDELSKEIEDLESTGIPENLAAAEQKKKEIQKVENDPEYQRLNEKIRQQEETINEHPVDTDYQVNQAKYEQEENTSMYNFLKYEFPKELGGTASEIGTQLATTYGPKLINSLVKKAVISAEAGPYAPAIMGALTVAEVGAGLYGLWKMRDAESDAEVNDAYEQKVAQMTDELVASRGGAEPTERELRDIRIEAHKGLEQLKAQNMNLMLGDALEVLVLGRFNILGKFGNLGEATRFGRAAKTVGGGIINAYSEQMEETDQFGYKSQYIAGKLKDGASFGENFNNSLNTRLSSLNYALTGKSGEGYEDDAEYRNAARSGLVLGGLMGGAGTIAKAVGDERQFYKTAAEVKEMTPQMIQQEKADYRAKIYTKYFGQDKGNFLIEGLQNLVKSTTDPKELAAIQEEVVKAKEGERLYSKMKDIHKHLSPNEINTLYNKAQHLTSSIEDMERVDNSNAEEHIKETADVYKLSENASLNQALSERAKLEALRNQLDEYYSLDDKPSNITEYEKIVEDKYKSALESYKSILENNNISEKEINKSLNSIEKLSKIEKKRLNNELVRSDLRGKLAHITTTQGAQYYLKGEDKKKSTSKPFDISTATNEEYTSHENRQLGKARLKYRINKTEREAFDKNLKSRLANESLEDILDDVNANNPKLTKEGSELLNSSIAAKKQEVNRDKARINELYIKEEDSQIPGGEEFTEDDVKELDELKAKDYSRFEQASDNYSTKEKSYLDEIPEATDNKIKRQIKESFLQGSTAVQDHFAKNSDYSKLNDVENEIKKVENLKKIYDSRDETIKTSKEFEGVSELLDNHLTKLNEIKAEVTKRIADRDARDKRIPGNQTRLIFNQLGLNVDGTVIAGKEAINEAVKKIIGIDVYDSIIADANGNLTRIHGDIIVQLIKNSKVDKTVLTEAIAKTKSELEFSLFEIPRVDTMLQVTAEGGSHKGDLINAYITNPIASFVSIINNIRDNQGSNPFDGRKESSVYKFLKDFDLVEFVKNVEEEDRTDSVISKEELLSIIKAHNSYSALFELEKNLKSEANVGVELSRELDLEKKFANKDNRNTPTPSNQQTVAIRQLYNFLKTSFKGDKRFDGFAYLKGFAGTGKTNVVMRWVFKLSGLSKSSLYTAGHNSHSAETIAKSLGKDGEVNSIEKAIIDIPTLGEDIKLIVLDEAPGVSQDNMIAFADAIVEANKTRKNKLRVIMLGDPNQVTANGSYSSIEGAVTIKGAHRITQISPLTIRYRTDVAPIVDFQDLFIDQDKDLTKTPIYVKANTDAPSSFSSSLMGVNGTKDFDKEVVEVLKSRTDNRSRAIIVNDANDVQKYTDLLAANGITGVEVLTFVDAQGRTIDEVYQNVKYNNSFSDMKAYNTAVYTAASRATKYLFVGSLPIENSVDNTVEDVANDRAEQNKNRSTSFIKEREEELNKVEKFINEPATEEEVETEIDEEEDNEDVESTEEQEESNIGDGEEELEVEEVEEELPTEEFVEPEVEILVNDADDLSDLEDNSQQHTNFSSISESSHVIDNPTSTTIATLKKDGSYGEGVKAGNKVIYVLRKKTDGTKQIVIVSPLGGDKYAEVGVLSSEELTNPPAGFEEAYKTLLDTVNDPTAAPEDFRYEKNKVFTISDIQPLLEGKIEYAQKLSYKYNRNPQPLSIQSIKERFLATFFPLNNLLNKKAVKTSIRIFSHKEIEEAAKNKKLNLPFNPIAGIPYLMIEGLQQKGKVQEQLSKVQLIRLSPAKLNNVKHEKYVKPVTDFIAKVKEIHSLLDTLEGGKDVRLGTTKFAKLLKEKPKYRTKLLEKYGIDVAEFEAKGFDKLFSELNNLAFEYKEETIKASDRKKIFKGNTVIFDVTEGKEENKFDGQKKIKSIKDKVATLSNGMEVPISELVRVPVIQAHNGIAQKAIASIALSNPKVNGFELNRTFTEKVLDKAGNVIGNKESKATRKLLDTTNPSYTLEVLEAIFNFDANGDSTVNNGFGIRVPLSKKDFPSDNKPSSDIKVEDYLLDTFEEVVPTSIAVSITSAKKTEGVQVTTAAKPKEETVINTEDELDEFDAYDRGLSKNIVNDSQLGKKLSTKSVFGLVKKLLPNISNNEVKIISEAQMLVVTGGKEAWGYFKQGIIYLLEGAEGIGQKVVMHEVFHKIFAENFTQAERNKLIAIARRDNVHLRAASKEKVEEFLAEKYQDWKNKRGTVSLILVNFFKKLANILGLYSTNFNNIESVMADIDNGILGRKKGEVVYEGRAMLKIREDYLSTRHFREAKHQVTTTISKLINASVTTKEGIGKVKLTSDLSNLKAAFPMEFEEALKEFSAIVKAKKEAFTNDINSGKYEGQKLETATFLKETYEILSNDKVRKELLETIYPSIYMSSEEFGETTDETFNNEQKGIADDAMDADMINHERSIGPSVKDMLATITYVENGKLKIVNPRFAFVKLLQAFDNVDTLNLENMLFQIKEQLAAQGNPSVEAIGKRIEDLILDARKGVYTNKEGKRTILSKEIEFVDTNKFIYYGITPITVVKQKGESTVDFVRRSYSKMNEIGMDISFEELHAHYDKMKARTTLAAIRTAIGSLRQKNVMIGVKVFENIEKDSTGKTLRDNNGNRIVHYSTHYRYNSVREKGTVQNVRNEIENAILNNHTEIDSELAASFKKAKNDEDKLELIEKFFDTVNIAFNGSIPSEVFSKTFNDIKGLVDAIQTVNDKVTIEKVIEESNERLKTITNVVSKNNESLKSVSYIAGDGTKRYEWLASSYGVDVLKYLASSAKRKLENLKNFEFVNAPIFKGNPLLNKEGDKVFNKIHRYVDHDSVKDKDDKYPAVAYKEETTNDWFSRTINMAFISMLENRKEDSKGNKRYVQFAYTISNKPQIIGAEMDLKSDSEIKDFIAAALEQQNNRPDFDIKNYNKDANFFKGKTVEEVHSYLEKVAEELTQQLIDAKFVPDYKIGQIQDSLVNQIASKFVKDGKLINNVEGIVKVKRDSYNLTKEQLLPVMDLFVKNYYMNGYFMNQMIMGDQAFFKSTADQIKRMSVGFSMGQTGLVNEEAGFMDEKFNVVVSDDIENTIGEQFSKFKKFYGLKFNRTDGAAFMTPERFENIKRGFSPEMNLGNTMKPVYWGIDKHGIPRAMKYSVVVLSDELCANNPQLAQLREQMRNTKGTNGKPIGEYVFVSGFKVGAPNELTNPEKVFTEGINPESIVEMDNRNWRIQLNPAHDVNGTIANPTQLTYFANFNGTNKELADKLYDLNSELILRGLAKLDTKVGEGAGTLAKIRATVVSSLGKTEARLHEFLSTKDSEGNPMISLNFPVAVNKVVTQLGSTVSKATVKVKYPGAKLVLQPDYGIDFIDDKGVRRKLKFREKYENQKGEEVEYMEVILPNMYKDQFKKGDILFESHMAFRIPSTELHSSVPIKVVDFYDSKGTNIVIAPGEITAAHGSDYDIDALFIMRREVYKKADVEGLLFKGQIIGYTKDGKRIENFHLALQKRMSQITREIQSVKNKNKRIELRETLKQLDKAYDAALKNEVLETFLDIITDPKNGDTMMTPISMARLNGKTNSVVSEFNELGIETGTNFDLNDPRDQAQIHKDNFAGSTLTATLADNVRGLAYALQSYIPTKNTLSERIARLKEIPEGKELLEQIISEDYEGSVSIKERVEELEKKYNISSSLNLNPPIDEKNHINIDDVIYGSISREEIYNEEDTAAGKNLDKDDKPFKISETLDALINAALDNVKEQILSIINLSNNTAESFIAMISMGIPLNTVAKYMITPAIRQVSDSRKFKDGMASAKSTLNLKIAEKFLEGEKAISKEELDAKRAEVKVTVKGLNELVVTPYDKMTGEQLLLQEKLLQDFAKAQKVGAYLNHITKETKILKELPVTQEEIADKMDLFEATRKETKPTIKGVDIMRIPHIAAAYRALSKLNLMVNTNFYKHREEINNLAKDISGQLGIRLDFNKNKNLRMIRDEVSKFVLSSISYEADGIQHDFDTSKEEPFSYKNYKDEDKDAIGTDAFNQRFIERVQELKDTYPSNKFLKGLAISKDFATGMNRLVFTDSTNFEIDEIIDIQDDFKKLMVNGKFTQDQRDFVKYAVLNYGLSFGTSNYTLMLPVEVYSGVSKAMDELFDFMLNKRDTETTNKRLQNISQFIAIQMGVNEIDSLSQNNDFVANGKYPAYGVDETVTGNVRYDMKFTIDKQGIVKDEEGTTEEQDNENQEEVQALEDGLKSSEVQLQKGKKLKLPLMLKHYDKAYIRLPQHDGDTHIYYREIARRKYSKYYYSGTELLRKLMVMGYNIGDIFERDALVRSVINPLTNKYSAKVSEKSTILEVGQYITLKGYADIAQVNAFQYRIKDIKFFDATDEEVSREEAVRVEYDLANRKELLILDDSKLSDEDRADLNNLC